jgi:ADP-ribosyl-[dinitrogen reductase] hydrolase
MLGALVGDAAGATLEFYRRPITEDQALQAMKMPGGGMYKVGPGQITDDGELTLALWQSLNSFETSSVIPILTLMRGYSEWYESIPFDIGQTCSLAFEVYNDYFNGQNFQTVEDCKKEVSYLNKHSEANGALMRATAIATWIAKTPHHDPFLGIECAKEDARLSHPSIVCQEVNAIYVFAIILLLRGNSPQTVINLIDDYVNNQVTSEKVRTWYFDESLDITNMICTQQMGHVRWGFVLAMYFLRNPQITFEEAIKLTLMKGGDTDTNAAIVGGLVGAYQPIPDYMLKPVLELDCTIESPKHQKRPAKYSVNKVIGELI